MNTNWVDQIADPLMPLEFVERRDAVACTPVRTVELAFVGLSAICVGYYAAKAINYGKGNFDARADRVVSDGVSLPEALSAAELVHARAAVVASS